MLGFRWVLINYIWPAVSINIIDINLFFIKIQIDINKYLDLFIDLLSLLLGLGVKGIIEVSVKPIFLDFEPEKMTIGGGVILY